MAEFLQQKHTFKKHLNQINIKINFKYLIIDIKIYIQQMVFNEIIVLKSVFHPGIVEMYEIIQEKDRLIIILEFLAGGTLY